MSTVSERGRLSPAPMGEASPCLQSPESAEVVDTRRKLATLLAIGAVRAAHRRRAAVTGGAVAAPSRSVATPNGTPAGDGGA